MNRNRLGENLKRLRKASGLTQANIGDMLSISKRSIANIENGVKFDSFDFIDKLLDFYGLTFDDVGYVNYSIPVYFRKEMINRHINNQEYIVLLDRKPTIPFAIKQILLESEFLKLPKEVNEIKNFFEEEGWFWTGTSISTALKRLENTGITINRNLEKGGTFEYSKSK